MFYLQEVIQIQKELKEALTYIGIKTNNIHFILMEQHGTIGVNKEITKEL